MFCSKFDKIGHTNKPLPTDIEIKLFIQKSPGSELSGSPSETSSEVEGKKIFLPNSQHHQNNVYSCHQALSQLTKDHA